MPNLSLIDNIFANTIEHTPISGNLTCKISDHLPNFLILQEFGNDIKKTKITRRSYDKFNNINFLKDLEDPNVHSQIQNSSDTNDKYNILHNHLINVINKHAPLKTLSIKESTNALKP